MALPPTFQSRGAYMCSIGFGFDSVTDDYKVVRIVYLDGLNFDQNYPPEVEIFSLSTGTWRNISHLDLPYTICKYAPQAYVNGAAHWLARDWRSSSNSFLYFLILSFHMGDEVFVKIKLPGNVNAFAFNNGEENVRLATFQESLSLICVDVSMTGRHTCCIWVMKEYGISESWSKQFNIDMRKIKMFEECSWLYKKR
ncbi:F-box/kelch-repeat protein At3g06240-like [Cornus florida]|uniref:F-box/kelch-repeat protein At3g06240-like n=1 Tax=Cornus florida TaxID=4283 RepID=UPI0028A0A41C|nr:F-box/kelch-repeat protein At3g06240-like [Cornus florida]